MCDECREDVHIVGCMRSAYRRTMYTIGRLTCSALALLVL